MGKTKEISCLDDIIDVRDVIARFEALESEIEAEEISEDNGAEAREDDDGNMVVENCTCGTCGKTWNDALITSSTPAPSGRCPYEGIHEEIEEHKRLKSLLEELQGNGGDEQWRGDWYPITMIRSTYFVEAMQELCEDIGDVPPKGFPAYMVIDWEATAENLKADYSAVDFDGAEYYYR